MSLTSPKGNIPIGSVTVNGQRVPVTIDPEWLRYLSQGLLDRVGGVDADDLASVGEVASQALFKSHAPQPQAPIDVWPYLAASRSFGPRPTQERSVDDAQAILARRVFR